MLQLLWMRLSFWIITMAPRRSRMNGSRAPGASVNSLPFVLIDDVSVSGFASTTKPKRWGKVHFHHCERRSRTRRGKWAATKLKCTAGRSIFMDPPLSTFANAAGISFRVACTPTKMVSRTLICPKSPNGRGRKAACCTCRGCPPRERSTHTRQPGGKAFARTVSWRQAEAGLGCFAKASTAGGGAVKGEPCSEQSERSPGIQ